MPSIWYLKNNEGLGDISLPSTEACVSHSLSGGSYVQVQHMAERTRKPPGLGSKTTNRDRLREEACTQSTS